MHKLILTRVLTCSVGTGIVVTVPLMMALTLTDSPTVWAQNVSPQPNSRGELIPSITIRRPAQGATFAAAPSTADGWVHRNDGAQISNVKVLIHRDRGGSGRGYLGGDGQFHDVTPGNSGPYFRSAQLNPGGTWSVNINLPAGDIVGEYTLKAIATDADNRQASDANGFSIEANTNYTISGSVRNRDNSGASGVPVGARPTNSDAWQDTTTDSQGNYTLPNVTAGSWIVTVRDRISDPHDTTVTLTENSRYASASFFLGEATPSSAHTISGAVRTRDGRGVAGVPVGARPSNSSAWQDATTDAQGSYTISNVAAGEWIVTVRDRQSDPHDTTVTLTDSVPSASASFFLDTSGPLLNPHISQAASDALRAVGIAQNRVGQTVGNAEESANVHHASGTENGRSYGNAIDIEPASTHDDVVREIHALRMAGFAAWSRTVEIPTSNPHYHVVWAGSANRNEDQMQQIRSFVERDAGLSSEHWEPQPPITQEEAEAVRAAFERVNSAGSVNNYRRYEEAH